MVIDSDTLMNMMIVILTNDSYDNDDNNNDNNDDDDNDDVDRGVMISYYVYLSSSNYIVLESLYFSLKLCK